MEDLTNIKYVYSNKFLKNINFKNKDYINQYSKFNYYLPQNIILDLKTNSRNVIKIINHYDFLKKYSNILLIINYNSKGFENLNRYMIKLYQNYFDNIVFITPSKINTKKIFSCNESSYGFYSYICILKIYEKYPDYKGYLFTNDDVFMKIWELKNLDFNIPWLYDFVPPNWHWLKASKCTKTYKILNNNIKWKQNLSRFLGDNYYIPAALSDFYYMPNYFISQLNKIYKIMYNSKIFLECAVPTSFGILLNKEYQLIFIHALWGRERRNAINTLLKESLQITIHPIKFFNSYFQKKVNQYIYFIEAKEY